jgi:hypothetical protein
MVARHASIRALRRDGITMRKFGLLFVVVVAIFMCLGVPCLAQDFKPYAGSKLDEKATSEASKAAPGKKSEVYTTPDSFDKVYAFYKSLYKEYAMAHQPPKLPSGQQIQWAFFILDGEKDLKSSKFWMKIQRPYIGGTEGQDTRDITVIQTVRSN